MFRWLKRKKAQVKEVVQTVIPPKQQPVGREFVPWVKWGYCPDCGANDQWIEGPSGGMCVNYTCDACGARFNIAGPPLKLIQRIGQW